MSEMLKPPAGVFVPVAPTRRRQELPPVALLDSVIDPVAPSGLVVLPPTDNLGPPPQEPPMVTQLSCVIESAMPPPEGGSTLNRLGRTVIDDPLALLEGAVPIVREVSEAIATTLLV